MKRLAGAYAIGVVSSREPHRVVDEGGIGVPGEFYRLPDEVWAKVEAGEPPGLYRGPVELDDGRWVDGILFPEEMTVGQREITSFGGWRAYWDARERGEVD